MAHDVKVQCIPWGTAVPHSFVDGRKNSYSKSHRLSCTDLKHLGSLAFDRCGHWPPLLMATPVPRALGDARRRRFRQPRLLPWRAIEVFQGDTRCSIAVLKERSLRQRPFVGPKARHDKGHAMDRATFLLFIHTFTRETPAKRLALRRARAVPIQEGRWKFRSCER